MSKMTTDIIVVPPATTADVLTPITTELLTYALLQNKISANSTLPVTQANVCYRFQHDPNATSTQITKPADATPVSTESKIPCEVTDLPTTATQSEPTVTASSPSKITKQNDAVFLTPLPIITYTKPPNRIAKPHPKPKPSNPNQNQLIKALLAQKSTPGPYVSRPQTPRSTTSFIIRASTQSPSGKTQILNLPVSVSTPVSIVRNVSHGGSVRSTIAHNLLVKELGQRPARSAFVKTSVGSDFTARNLALATVVSTHATTTMAITTPMTLVSPVTYSISPIIATTGTGAVVTTTVSSATTKPLVFTTTVASRTRTKSFPTYTKTYIPVPHVRAPNKDLRKKLTPTTFTATKTHNLVGSRVLPACPNTRPSIPPGVTMLGPGGVVTTSTLAPTIVQRSQTRANFIPGYKSRYLEPGEIPQVRKIPPRTFPGPRSVSAAQRQAADYAQQQATMAQLKAARHAEHHAESQSQLRALQAHGASRAILHATSLAALQAASHAQLEAASQARLKVQQAKDKDAAQKQLPATSQAQLQITSLGQLQTVSLAQPQGTLNLQLLNASQAQLLANSKLQLLATSQAELQATSQEQPQSTSQVQLLKTAQAQPQGTSAQSQEVPQAQLEASSQAVSQAQFQEISQSQFQAVSKLQLQAASQAQQDTSQFQEVSRAQILTTTQVQLHAVSQAQLQGTSQAQFQVVSQSQLQAVSQAQHQTSQSQLHSVSLAHQVGHAKPSSRTHHRLIIRSAASSASGAERIITSPTSLQGIADAAVTVAKSPNEQLPNTSLQSIDVATSSIHTTSTLTLSTGTTLIMPHYKTTVFKNLSTIAHAEPTRIATPTTAAAAAERVVIRRPVAYFSARRTFPTQSSGTGTPVNVQRHIIRTIPRHILSAHLQSPATQAPSGPRMPQVISTSSSELPGLTTLSQNKPQSADKNK